MPWVAQRLRNEMVVRTMQELFSHSDIHASMRYVHYLQNHAVESVQADENWAADPTDLKIRESSK